VIQLKLRIQHNFYLGIGRMKFSLSWIFDHINTDWHSIDTHAMYELMANKVTEIENFCPVKINTDHLEYAQCIEIHEKEIKLISASGNILKLETRVDALLHHWYIIKKKNSTFQWATCNDFAGIKEGLLPAIDPKKSLSTIDDYIIEIDNKAITHRPDLWGHRGMAREIATLLDLKLKPLHELLFSVSVTNTLKNYSQLDNEFIIKKETDYCTRIAGGLIQNITYQPSDFEIAARLCRIDMRPIDFFVDATNYVMADIGQPMHAFDAHLLTEKALIARMGNNELLTTLDNQTITVTPNDIVIADEQKVLSLAGIMGGKSSGISPATQAILIESAHFDASKIRLSAQYHKKRTEASTRFEKNLDPYQNVIALQRFLYLIKDIPHITLPHSLISIGAVEKSAMIEINHSTIQNALGIQISDTFIMKTLQNLGFSIEQKNDLYSIIVPSYRVSKDITQACDIIEEIGRFYGYNNIISQSPLIPVRPKNTEYQKQLDTIKKLSAFGFQMHELNSYAFFDAQFISSLDWKPQQPAAVQSPVSNNWSQLNTTLIPHLLKAIQDNSADYSAYGFFEIAKIWEKSLQELIEKDVIAYTWYDYSGNFDFYSGKEKLTQLFDLCGCDVEWQPITEVETSDWYAPFVSAYLIINNTTIGKAGMLLPTHKRKLIKNAHATIFIAEIDLNPLLFKKRSITLQPISKYPQISRDINFLIPQTLAFETFKKAILSVDDRITSIDLLEFFEKDEWKNQRAITIRITIIDQHKTLLKQEIDAVIQKIIDAAASHQATVR
jgi:phenylalanyl-tRNA synthetase beta chain